MTCDVERHLFRPGRIGTLEIPNRVVLPPMLMGYGSEDGFVTERAKDYYAARARGGAGLVIVEASMPLPGGKMFKTYFDISDDRYLPGLTELAGVIKDNGARAAIQLGDGGREVRRDLTGRAPMGPSPVAARKREVPIEMTLSDIRDAVRGFAEAAHRAQRAGFEGVEIHGAHVYLLSQFLSGFTNFRTDEYGGSVENRFRILVDIVKATKRLTGDDFPVWLRINGVEFDTPNGVTLEESRAFARLAEEAGYDAISISAGSPHYEATMHTLYTPPKFLVPVAAAIKEVVSFPVMVAGKLTPEQGEDVLAAGEADFICIGRALMADPDLPRKVRDGQPEDVRPCPCLLDCVNRGVLRDQPLVCMSNAALGREREYAIEPVAEPGHVVVVGAGPAGLEAALVAAQRGHRVTLLERDAELGGQLVVSSRAPHKKDLTRLVDFYSTQLAKHGVEVVTGEEATASVVLERDPTAVVLATGESGCRTTSQGSVAQVDDLLTGEVPDGASVVVLGADTRSCELADLLTEGRSNQVVVSTDGRKVAPMLTGIVRGTLLERLKEKGVDQRTHTRIGAITSRTIELVGSEGVETVPADLLVLSGASTVDAALLDELRQAVPRTYVVGDAVEKGEHIDAISEGARIGRLV
ncbi:FAD-dependent oxidoreductase [Nocardioides sp. Y6]|uniref:FAD-dependent oxidoreductase n=1 Tax=Nocardioides malaquae TaxID=2773426 RepID=A0ABR9RT42_9ACTN|nr:FAD-dependent oxidoreductase [Nocardioides malaquae]MBE7324758.1 FAD-dependent oxidoreductase [Nocardioides malaquae]